MKQQVVVVVAITALFSFLSLLLLPSPVRAFTVIMSDPGLVDTPQTGFTMTNDEALTDPQEQAAVYEIMKATGNGWAESIPDVCRGRWHGIECMPDKDDVYHVVSLSFGSLSDDTAFPTCDPTLSFISPSLLKLPHIRTLFFYRCFTNNPQPIPSFLSQLGPTLQSLVLRENGHVGSIPFQLGNLTWLRVLDLHANNLSSIIPSSLARLNRLRSLDLSNNRLTGGIPNLPTQMLNVLDLSQNFIQGQIPASLGKSTSLIKMDLSKNRLSGPIPDSLDGLKNLILLDLSYNRLVGPLPDSLGSLISLRVLILKVNSMENTRIPNETFSKLENLMVLVLSDMELEGPIPESLSRLPSLRVLHLDRNGLNGSIPLSFKGSENFSELRMNDNRLTGLIPFGKDMVWRLGRKLKLANNSGLCYDSSIGSDDSFELGIGYCDSEMTRPMTKQHLSSVDLQQPGQIHHSFSGSSSSAPIHMFLRLRVVILLLALLLL
ncbi:leucine-rich repeat (LRR) family protein [Tasmannia lanceolata]|uniref:leucine-rich repeat (LRR) family protein n=1 Tax=Tasmannia lanceolata TaxID=3420 RepID=UPI0040649E25